MAGEGQLREQAKYQWDRLDMEGCKILNKILTATPERVEWLEGAEPKFTRKKTSKATRVAYDTKTKRYTYHDNNVVAAGEPIRLETSDTFSTSATTQREKNTLGSNHQPDWRQTLVCHNSIQLPLD